MASSSRPPWLCRHFLFRGPQGLNPTRIIAKAYPSSWWRVEYAWIGRVLDSRAPEYELGTTFTKGDSRAKVTLSAAQLEGLLGALATLRPDRASAPVDVPLPGGMLVRHEVRRGLLGRKLELRLHIWPTPQTHGGRLTGKRLQTSAATLPRLLRAGAAFLRRARLHADRTAG